jgi:hypothetical protein
VRGENKGKPKARALDIRLQKRRELALRLRLTGASFRDIARSVKEAVKEVGGEYQGVATQKYNESDAFRDVVTEFHRLKETCSEKAEDILTMELQRLDEMLVGIYDPATHGDPVAVNTALRIMDRRARYLGIDAPTKIAPTNPEGNAEYYGMSDTELAARINEILERARERAAAAAGAGTTPPE